MLIRTLAGAAAAALTFTACAAEPEQPVRDDTGAIVEANEAADIFALTVGDCTMDGDADEAVEVAVVPCAEPHDYEVYHAADLPDGEFPGSEALEEAAGEICTEAFEEFIGISYEESAYHLFYYTPTKGSWDQGDREILCLVYADGEQVTGSLAGVAE